MQERKKKVIVTTKKVKLKKKNRNNTVELSLESTANQRSLLAHRIGKKKNDSPFDTFYGIFRTLHDHNKRQN